MDVYEHEQLGQSFVGKVRGWMFYSGTTMVENAMGARMRTAALVALAGLAALAVLAIVGRAPGES
jgi:hypothetical protein